MQCLKCGTEIKEGNYCPECGNKINSDKENSTNEDKLKGWEGLAIVLLLPFMLYWLLGPIVAVIGFIIAIWYVNKKGIKKKNK